MFMITTTDGVRVLASVGSKEGMPQEQAESSAKERNDRAATMGLKARYVAVPYAPVAK